MKSIHARYQMRGIMSDDEEAEQEIKEVDSETKQDLTEKKTDVEKELITIYQQKLMSYFKDQHPDKLRFNPKIIHVGQEKVSFGMNKHYGKLFLTKVILDAY